MSNTFDTTPVVELINVVKSFESGRIRSLDGLDLTVAQGECVAVTGPSGCGKSTMLHLIAALDQPTSGTIRVGGRNLAELKNPAKYRRTDVGVIFQFHYLLPQLSAVQNLEIALIGTGLSRSERLERATKLLDDVDLSNRRHQLPTKLSGGERQRTAIARALVNSPRIILADEPTGNLDPFSVGRVLDLFNRLRKARPSLTLIIVTHDHRVIESTDRVVHLAGGRVADHPTRVRQESGKVNESE